MAQSQPPAWEPPNEDRPASALPTAEQVQHEVPTATTLDYSPPPPPYDPSAPQPPRHDAYAAWRLRPYRQLAISTVLMFLGAQIQSTAVAYQIYTTTGSSLALGYLGLIMALPTIILSLPAGQLADLVPRRRLMIMVLVFVTAVSLALCANSAFFTGHWVFLPAMYGILLTGGIAGTLGRPARAAMLPQLVPASVFPNAVTWNSSLFELSAMVGPAAGGLLLAYDINIAYAVAAAMFASALVLTTQLPNVPVPPDARAGGFAALLEGVRFVWRTRMMFAAMLLDLVAVLLGGAVYLLPIYAADILNVGAWGFGLLRAAPAVGAVVMALVLAHLPPLRGAGWKLIYAVAGFGIATIVFGYSTSFILSLAMLAIVGACDNISVVVRHSLVQLLTPDRMRGRVSAVNMVFIGSSNELGGMRAGMMGHAVGPVASVVLGGLGTLAAVAGIAAIFPSLRKLNRLDELKPIDPAASAETDTNQPDDSTPAAIPTTEDAAPAPVR